MTGPDEHITGARVAVEVEEGFAHAEQDSAGGSRVLARKTEVRRGTRQDSRDSRNSCKTHRSWRVRSPKYRRGFPHRQHEHGVGVSMTRAKFAGGSCERSRPQ